MGKIKTLALTGIMLSSTVLGASPLIVQAKETAAPSITATNALSQATTSTATAAKGTATTFKDLENNATMSVAPIFGKSGSDFNTDLANELNITTSSTDTTQIPMTVVDSNKFGFATKVTFTSGDTTKTVNVQYNYAKPTVAFGKDNASQVMNFTTTTAPAQTEFAAKVVNKDVSAESTNGTDAKGVKNSKTLLTDMSTSDIQDPGSYTVTYTAKDNYTTGDAVNRTVNVFGEPDWKDVETRDVVAGDTNATTNPVVITNSQGQKFSVSAVVKDDAQKTAFAQATKDEYKVTYTATAIDAEGNPLADSSTGDKKTPITFTKDGTVNIVDPKDTDVTTLPYAINYMYKDKVVGTQFGTTTKTVVTDTDDNNNPSEDSDSETGEAANNPEAPATRAAVVDNGSGTTGTTSKADTTTNDHTVTLKTPTGYVLAKDVPATHEFKDDDTTGRTITADVVPETLKYTVNYIDQDAASDAKPVATVTGTGSYNEYVSLTAPKGYELSNVVDRGFTLKKDGYTRDVYIKKSNVAYVITFVDQETGRTIGITTGEGADGEDVTLTAPDGYSFLNADDMQMTINKDNPNKSIEVAPNTSDFMGTITTYPNKGYTDLYSNKGTLLDDVVVSSNSSWITDKKVYINGVKYYRVATNQYIKASDAYLYTPISKIAQINGKTNAKVYDSKGTLINDRALATNSAWKADKAARINGEKMYRVATNEWVKDSDVSLL